MSHIVKKTLVFAGSLRKDSYNKKIAIMMNDVLLSLKEQTTLIDISDYPMPIYDGDIEEKKGIPEIAIQFRALMQEHDAFLISCPEYNGSISGVLKNIIDWCSRPKEGEEPLICFKNKIVLLLGASPGQLGGLRGLNHVRDIFYGLGSVVLPYQLAFPKIHEDLEKDPDGIKPKLEVVANSFVEYVDSLR